MSKQLLTQEELQELKNIKNEVLSVASALGELEYQNTIIKIEKEKLVEQVEDIKEREQLLLKSFGQKYGDGIVNLETGEIDPRS
jgi:hypothetical protein